MEKKGEFSKIKNIGLAVLVLSGIGSLDAQESILERQVAEEFDRLQILQEQDRKSEIFKEESKGLIKQVSERKMPQQLPEQKIEGAYAGYYIAKIKIHDAFLLNRQQIRNLTQRYLKTEMNLNDINTLMRKITNLYIKLGYITTRVYLPQQNLEDAVLEIMVVEGIISKIRLNGQSYRGELWTAFPHSNRRPLNLRYLEQGVEQMNRLQSNNVIMEIDSGLIQGESIVNLKNTPSNPYRVKMRYNNVVRDKVGVFPHSFNLSRDNLLTINDQWSVNYTQFNGEKSQNSNSVGISASVPMGYMTASAGYTKSENVLLIKTPEANKVSSGRFESLSLGLDRVIQRGSRTKSNLKFGLTTKDNKQFLEDVKLRGGTRRLVVADLTAQHVHRRFGAVGIASIAYHQGMSRFKADIDSPAADKTTPKAQFKKIIGDLTLTKPLFNYRTTFKSSLHALYTADALYATEGIGIGGLHTVRGFRNGLVGDKGYYLQNELIFPFLGKRGLNLLTAYDVGEVRSIGGADTPLGKDNGMLSGTALGIRYNSNSVSLDLVMSWPVHAPAGVEKGDGQLYGNIAIVLL